MGGVVPLPNLRTACSRRSQTLKNGPRSRTCAMFSGKLWKIGFRRTAPEGASNFEELTASLKLFSLMTSFTDCYHNILYTSARAERGREGTTSPRPRGQDAVENDGCEGSTRTLCDRSQPASRKLRRGVPGVWDLSADGISVAE